MWAESHMGIPQSGNFKLYIYIHVWVLLVHVTFYTSYEFLGTHYYSHASNVLFSIISTSMDTYIYIYNTSGTFSVETMFFFTFKDSSRSHGFKTAAKAIQLHCTKMCLAWHQGDGDSMVIPWVRHGAIGSQPADWDAKFVCVSHISTLGDRFALIYL